MFFRQPCKLLYFPTKLILDLHESAVLGNQREIYPSVSAIQGNGHSEQQAGILGPYPVGSFDHKHLSLHVLSLPAEAIFGAVQW